MKETVSKFAPPIILTTIGITVLVLWQVKDQNSYFLYGGLSLLLIAIVSLLNTLGHVSNKIGTIVSFVLVGLSIGLVSLNYSSIDEPIQFLKEKNRRYTHVIQRLKDIREAEIAYKKKYKSYTNNFDTLNHFLTHDSIFVINKSPDTGDSLTVAQAVERGLYVMDTTLVPAIEKVYNKDYKTTRTAGVKLNLDSLRFVPFTSAEFELKTAEIERGSGIKVNVFQCRDAEPFDKKDVMQVGSLTEPTTAGNWKEEK